MTTTPDPIAAIERAMEGVTLTSWGQGEFVGYLVLDVSVPAHLPLAAVCEASSPDIAAYIAACNPVAITALLALARQAAEKDAEIARLREALSPFAECAPEWESEPDSLHVFFEWNDENAPVPSLPVADFRRARALLGGYENAE